jgi:hypothetical protein
MLLLYCSSSFPRLDVGNADMYVIKLLLADMNGNETVV